MRKNIFAVYNIFLGGLLYIRDYIGDLRDVYIYIFIYVYMSIYKGYLDDLL